MIEDMNLAQSRPGQSRFTSSVSLSLHNTSASRPRSWDADDVRAYLVHLVHKRRVSWSYYNQALCALRFLYNVTLGKDRIVKSIVCPKQEKRFTKDQ